MFLNTEIKYLECVMLYDYVQSTVGYCVCVSVCICVYMYMCMCVYVICMCMLYVCVICVYISLLLFHPVRLQKVTLPIAEISPADLAAL